MHDPMFQLDFRRVQMHEQQAEKQKKNPLQKALVFTRRANELVSQESWLQLQYVPFAYHCLIVLV